MAIIRALVIAVGLTFSVAQTASAEMGKAPVGPGGVYGGFTSAFASANEPETQMIDRLTGAELLGMNPDGGLEGGVHFGYVITEQFLGLANFRFEGRL